MMVRTQISLDPTLQRRAREHASHLGVSLAEYVRQLVVRDLGAPKKQADVSRIFELGSFGGSSVARDKDAMIAEAFEQERARSRRRAPLK